MSELAEMTVGQLGFSCPAMRDFSSRAGYQHPDAALPGDYFPYVANTDAALIIIALFYANGRAIA